MSLQNEEILTLFYSNYSSNCKALLQYLNNSKIMEKAAIKFINIDNSEIKRLVEKKFTSVPVLVVINGEDISAYTGKNVFEWFVDFYAEKEKSQTIATESTLPIGTKLQSEPSKVEQTKTKTITELAAEISKGRESIN
jgi:thioredoxin-like negative regulator of GroEL